MYIIPCPTPFWPRLFCRFFFGDMCKRRIPQKETEYTKDAPLLGRGRINEYSVQENTQHMFPTRKGRWIAFQNERLHLPDCPPTPLKNMQTLYYCAFRRQSASSLFISSSGPEKIFVLFNLAIHSFIIENVTIKFPRIVYDHIPVHRPSKHSSSRSQI